MSPQLRSVSWVIMLRAYRTRGWCVCVCTCVRFIRCTGTRVVVWSHVSTCSFMRVLLDPSHEGATPSSPIDTASATPSCPIDTTSVQHNPMCTLCRGRDTLVYNTKFPFPLCSFPHHPQTHCTHPQSRHGEGHEELLFKTINSLKAIAAVSVGSRACWMVISFLSFWFFF